MYKVKKIKKYQGTRDVFLKNMETKKLETCFDDSEVSCRYGFEFIEKNKLYDCKIALFADPLENPEITPYGTVSIFNVVGIEKIGIKEMAKLELNGNYYYVSQKIIQDYIKEDKVILKYTRKDLIQVEEVIHEMMMCDYW